MDNLTSGNPVAHRVRVYYTGSDTLVEGEPLCYSFKTTRNWFGGSVNNEGEVTASEYVAEGSHNASKYMCVESPFQAAITSMDSVAGSNVITGDGTDFAHFHVGMAVSIASGSDATADGNYVITAVGALGVTITLDMTAAEAATVTTQADVTVGIDNVSSFAGVVAKGGWCGKAGPRVVDVYVPNGAVVPVRTDQNCVLGKTILAVHTNEQFLTASHATYSRPVAIAWETVDRGTTAGLTLAKLDTRLFIHQAGDNAALELDDKDTTSATIVNSINVKSLQTGGRFTALDITAESAAGASHAWSYGIGLNVTAKVTASVAATVAGTYLGLELTGGTLSEYGSACQICLYETGATISSMGGRLSVLNLVSQVADTPPTNKFGWMYLQNDGAEAPDFLLMAGTSTDFPMAVKQGTCAISHVIPIRDNNATYYIMVTNEA